MPGFNEACSESARVYPASAAAVTDRWATGRDENERIIALFTDIDAKAVIQGAKANPGCSTGVRVGAGG